MDKRTRVNRVLPAKTVVMKTPPKMTIVSERKPNELHDSGKAGNLLRATRMSPATQVESERTSLFVRRPTAENAQDKNIDGDVRAQKGTPLVATRMVQSPYRGGSEFLPCRTPSDSRQPARPPGPLAPKVRLRTQEIRGNMERLVKPLVICTGITVLVALVMAFNSVDVDDTNVVATNVSAKIEEPQKVAKRGSGSSEVESDTSELRGDEISEKNVASQSDSLVRTGQVELESEGAILVLAGRHREALRVYRRISDSAEPSEGVIAMVIVLEQKVGSQ